MFGARECEAHHLASYGYAKSGPRSAASDLPGEVQTGTRPCSQVFDIGRVRGIRQERDT